MAKAAIHMRTPRTSAGLCDALFYELDEVRNGRGNDKRVNNVSRIVGRIVSVKRMEIDAANSVRLGKRIRPIGLETQSVRIGSRA